MTKPRTMTITLNRTIPASPDEVYEAWLDPEKPGTPWHRASKLILTPKVGSLFHFTTAKDPGNGWPHYGCFTTLERPAKIEYTWMSPFTHGLESIVTVELQKQGDDTLLQLRHANLPDDDDGHLHETGWSELIVKLTDRLGARRSK
ncbi:MAG TPA: SRPBCC domain-containing protein [Polyangia bacterium]|nr:SRPBCC domain-containing protein [Polyangia bacterium]